VNKTKPKPIVMFAAESNSSIAILRKDW
jgi:hypothetical protein